MLAQIYTDIGAGKLQTVPQRLDAVAKDRGGNPCDCVVHRAAVAIEQNDRPAALAKFNTSPTTTTSPSPIAISR